MKLGLLIFPVLAAITAAGPLGERSLEFTRPVIAKVGKPIVWRSFKLTLITA
jgi:hypothetical protein